MDAKQALSDLIDSIDSVHGFVDLEAGQDRHGDVVRACEAINKPIPPNLAKWFEENETTDISDKFKRWLDSLNDEAARRNYADAATMWQDTGADAWRDYYDDGYSPADALTEDEREGT